MCFHRNINGNRDVKFLECDYLLVQRCVKLTLVVLRSQNHHLNKLKTLCLPDFGTFVLIFNSYPLVHPYQPHARPVLGFLGAADTFCGHQTGELNVQLHEMAHKNLRQILMSKTIRQLFHPDLRPLIWSLWPWFFHPSCQKVQQYQHQLRKKYKKIIYCLINILVSNYVLVFLYSVWF